MFWYQRRESTVCKPDPLPLHKCRVSRFLYPHEKMKNKTMSRSHVSNIFKRKGHTFSDTWVCFMFSHIFCVELAESPLVCDNKNMYNRFPSAARSAAKRSSNLGGIPVLNKGVKKGGALPTTSWCVNNLSTSKDEHHLEWVCTMTSCDSDQEPHKQNLTRDKYMQKLTSRSEGECLETDTDPKNRLNNLYCRARPIHNKSHYRESKVLQK